LVTQEYIDKINVALLEACPLASRDSEAVSIIKEKIQIYCREMGQPPTELTVVQLMIPFEQALLKKKEEAETAARQKQERADARKKAREFDRLPASAVKAQAIAELRQKTAQSEPERFTPEKEYTQAEIDRMTDAEMKRLLFGRESEPLNQSRPDERIRQANEKRILNTKRSQDTPLKRALRREILEGLQNG
jgi:hypothetical protein